MFWDSVRPQKDCQPETKTGHACDGGTNCAGNPQDDYDKLLRAATVRLQFSSFFFPELSQMHRNGNALSVNVANDA